MSDSSHGSALTAADREWLASVRSAERLSDLLAATGADSVHDAYFEAKRRWRALRERELSALGAGDGIPGRRVVVDGHAFHVHGVTHADTDAEGSFLREHVSRLVDRDAVIYCEQSVRPMYFADVPGVYAMDDYRWALQQCEELDGESRISGAAAPAFDGLAEDVDALAGRFREAAFSLVASGGDVYGDEFERALGDVVSALFASHEDAATGREFESYALTRRAARDPDRLADLQRYYETTFLPQSLEREWLRRHDPELELVTHARNERMADYAVYHNERATEVHLLVGAAHQPGVVEYLRQHRDGRRRVESFELVG